MPVWLMIFSSILGTMATLGVLLGGAAYFVGTVRKSNSELWKSNADAYEKSSNQKQGELNEIRERVTQLEKDLKSLQAEHTQVVRLNVELQLTIERKTSELVDVTRRLNEARDENLDLHRRLNAT